MTTQPTLNLAPGSDSGISHTDGITNDTSPVVTGTAQPFATVALSDADGTLALSTRADKNGNFIFFVTGLAAGTHVLTALAKDAAGNFSAPSTALNLDIQTDATATSVPAADPDPATATSVVFNLHFAQPVGALSATSFVLATTGTAFGTITAVSGSGEDYAVTATGLGGEGTVALAFSAQGPTDLAGNQVSLTSTQHGVSDTTMPTTTLVTSDQFGVQRTGASPAISGGGRIVAFISDDPQLTPATQTMAGVGNVYVKDLQTGAIALVTNGNDQTYHVEISLDGTVVAFSSAATDLVPGGTPEGELNLYVARLTAVNAAGGISFVPGSIVRVGVLDSDLALGSNVDGFALSGDGSTLAFGTDTTPPGADGTGTNSYSYSLATGAYTLIPGATSGDVTSTSTDGTKVAFTGEVAVPGTGGQSDPIYGGTTPPDYVQDAFVYDSKAKTTVTIDGTGLLGTVAPSGPDQVASYFVDDPQLSGDGNTLVFELRRGGTASSLFSVNLANSSMSTPVSPGAGTDGSGDYATDPSLSSGGSVIAYQNDDPTAGIQTVVYSTASHTTTTLGPGYDPVLSIQGNAIALSEPADSTGTRGITYETTLGVSAGISPIDGNDAVDKIDFAQAAASGLAVSGTSNAAPGSTVVLQVSDAVHGGYADRVTTTVGDGGQWSATIPAALFDPAQLPDGYYFLNVQVAGPAGTSPQVRRLFQVDTVAPAAPSAPVQDPGSNSGHDGIDTNVATPTLDGLAEAGATVILYDMSAGQAELATATVDQNGIYTLTSKPLADGAHTLAVEALDEAGNSSPLSGTLTIKVDTVAPDAPSAPELASGDAATNDSTPTLTGTAEANAFVTLYVNNGSLALGTARAGADGSYSVTSSKLADGDYTIAARATDAAGNVSALGDGTALEIDTRAPGTPVIGAINGQTQPDGTLAPSFDVTGSAGAQTTVVLQVDGVTVEADTAQTKASGAYDISVSNLGPGTHTIDVISTDPAGNTSQASATQQVTITSAAVPPAGTPPGATLLNGTLTDGPILGATVFADANGNGSPDAGEAIAVTGADGRFVLANPAGELVATGGTDTTTGESLPGPLFAPAGSTAVDPLTTLVYALTTTGQTVASANAAVTAALGLGAGTDLTTFDPYAAATAGSPALDPSVTDGAAEVAAAQLADLAVDTADAFGGFANGAGTVFDAVLQTVASKIGALAPGARLDLTDRVTLLGIVQTSVELAGFLNPDATVASAVEQIVAAGNAQLASSLAGSSGQALLDAVAAVQQVDQGVAGTALSRIGGNPGLAATLVPQFTGAPLQSATFAGSDLIDGAPVLSAASDAGLSDQDEDTDVTAPVFGGRAVPGTFVTLVEEESSNSGQVLGTGRADAFGHYSIASTTIAFQPYGVAVAALGSTTDPGVAVGDTVGITTDTQVQPIIFDVPANYGGYGGTAAFAFGATAVYSPANDANDTAVMLRIGATALGTIQVFVDGGTTPVASSPVISSDGLALVTTPVALGQHSFTVVETLPGGRVLPTGPAFTATIGAPVSVSGTARAIGAIAGGTVTNGNEPSDTTESIPSAVTDGSGGYTVTIDPRQIGGLILGDGYDTVTGLPLGGYAAGLDESDGKQGLATATLFAEVPDDGGDGPHELALPPGTAPLPQDADLGPVGITPLTSLLGDGDPDKLKALGLSPSTDLSNLDPLAEAEAGDTAPLLLTVKLMDAAAILGTVIGTTNFSAFGGIAAADGLDDTATLAAVVNNVYPYGLPDTVTEDGVEALAAIAAASNADLDAHVAASNSLADTLAYAFAAERVAQEEVPLALRNTRFTVNGDADSTTFAPVTAAFTGAALTAAVLAAEGDTTQATSFVPTGPASTDAARVTFRITFSHTVTGLTAGSFTPVASAGLFGAAVTGLAPVAGSNGTEYDVTVSTGAGSGTLALAYAGDGVQTATGGAITSGTLAPPVTYLPQADIGRGSAIATGDLNGDGRPDAVLLTSGESVEVTPFLNNGAGQFAAEAPISPDAGADYPYSPVIADVTGDGKADLLLEEYDPVIAGGYGTPSFGDSITVLPGNGDGSFGAAINTSIGFVPGQMVAGDFNGDGKLDVALTQYGGAKVQILLGNGDGRFTPAGSYAVGGNPYGLVAADLNGDGKLDLAVTNRDSNTVSVLLGAGDGTFAPAATPTVAVGAFPTGIKAADMNGDGIPDLVVADSGSDAVSVLLGQGGGAFAAPISFSFSGLTDLSNLSPNSVAVGDLNNDGIPDVAVEGLGGETEVLLGTGDGALRLGEVTQFGSTSSSDVEGIALADVDGDGRLDALVPGADTAPLDVTNGGLTVLTNEAQPVVGSTSAAVTVTRAALAQPVLTSASGTLTQSGTSYTLDLGQVAQGSSLAPLLFTLANDAAAGSDSFDGTFSAPSGDGFTATGASLPGPVAAGSSAAGPALAADTGTPGPHTFTLTFAPRDVTADPGATVADPAGDDAATLPPADSGGNDVSLELAPITLTVTDDVVASNGQPPAALGLAASSLTLPNVRVGATDTAALTVSNTATSGAASLDVTASASEDATTRGSIAGLQPGAADGTDLLAGLGTATAGAQGGTVTLAPVSDDAGVRAALPAQAVTVSGNVYRPAAAGTIAPVAAVLHVGGPGSFALTVANTDPADGYSEDLLARVAAAPAGLAASGGPTPEIAPGASDGSLTLTADTSAAGVLSGTAEVALTSDGGVGEGGIDGLGTLALSPQDVPVDVTVDNYAAPALAASVNGAAAAIAGGVLNLGTLQLGSGPVLVALTETNTAPGPADLLAAAFASSGGAGFADALGSVSGLGAGQSGAAGTVTLSTASPGTFTETVTADPLGSNASGYSGALAAQTLTITGTVVPGGSGLAPPAAPTLALVSPADGSAAQKAIIDTPTPAVAGATGAGAAVSILAGGATVGSTAADPATGSYTDTLSTGLGPGLSVLSASATNGAGTTPGAGTASAYALPAPAGGVSNADLASIDIGRLFDQGFVMQFTPGTEAVSLLDGVLSVGPDTDQAYVQRLYEGLLGRGDDLAGMSHWIGVLEAGGSKADVAAGFLTAPEFVADHGPASAVPGQQFVTMLYQGLLGRAPTDADMGFWTGRLAQDGQAAVLQGIADSPEAKAHGAAATAQVWAPTVLGTLDQELYGTGLGREAEPAGNAYWQGVLPGLTTAQAAALFTATPEFQALHAAQDPEAYVRSLFDAGLGRDPTAAEAQPLVAGLGNGTMSQADVLVQVATSPGAAAFLTRNLSGFPPPGGEAITSDVFAGQSATPAGYVFRG